VGSPCDERAHWYLDVRLVPLVIRAPTSASVSKSVDRRHRRIGGRAGGREGHAIAARCGPGLSFQVQILRSKVGEPVAGLMKNLAWGANGECLGVMLNEDTQGRAVASGAVNRGLSC